MNKKMEYCENTKDFLNSLSLNIYTLKKDETQKHKVKIVNLGQVSYLGLPEEKITELNDLIAKHSYKVSQTAMSIDKSEKFAKIKASSVKKSLKNLLKTIKNNKLEIYTKEKISKIIEHIELENVIF